MSGAEEPQEKAMGMHQVPAYILYNGVSIQQVIAVIDITRCQKSWQSAKIGARVDEVKSTKRQVGK